MKLYVLRERWGRYMTSPRPIGRREIPKEPAVRAGVGIEMVDWGDAVFLSWADKVIIWNVLVSFAVDTLGYHGAQVITFVNHWISMSIAYAKAWTLWSWGLAIGVYALVLYSMVMLAPEQREFIADEVFPWRYMMRYGSELWAADLISINRRGWPYYRICKPIGNVIIGEDRNRVFRLGVADLWDTGHLWVQKRKRFIFHEAWAWSHCWAEYIGTLKHVGANLYLLPKGFVDPYIAELPIPFIVPHEFRCRQWDPAYKMP